MKSNENRDTIVFLKLRFENVFGFPARKKAGVFKSDSDLKSAISESSVFEKDYCGRLV